MQKPEMQKQGKVAKSFLMGPISFHNITLKWPSLIPLPEWNRSAQNQRDREQPQESTGPYLEWQWKPTSNRQARPHLEHSLPSFLYSFPILLPPYAIIYKYNWEHRERALQWNTWWEMVRKRGPHEWEWPSLWASPHSPTWKSIIWAF